jgi:hypothetical protein
VPLNVVVMLWLPRLDIQTNSVSESPSNFVDFVRKVGLEGSLISTPLVLVRPGWWSSISSLPDNKIYEIYRTADLVWLFLSIEKEVGNNKV